MKRTALKHNKLSISDFCIIIIIMLLLLLFAVLIYIRIMQNYVAIIFTTNNLHGKFEIKAASTKLLSIYLFFSFKIYILLYFCCIVFISNFFGIILVLLTMSPPYNYFHILQCSNV